jgi:hypothetical protein
MRQRMALLVPSRVSPMPLRCKPVLPVPALA